MSEARPWVGGGVLTCGAARRFLPTAARRRRPGMRLEIWGRFTGLPMRSRSSSTLGSGRASGRDRNPPSPYGELLDGAASAGCCNLAPCAGGPSVDQKDQSQIRGLLHAGRGGCRPRALRFRKAFRRAWGWLSRASRERAACRPGCMGGAPAPVIPPRSRPNRVGRLAAPFAPESHPTGSP